MTHIDPGTQGAKRQTWRQGNPREMLKRIIEEASTTDREHLFRLFCDEVFKPGNQPILESIAEYWFSNNLLSLLERPKSGERLLKRQRMRLEAEQASKEIVQKLKLAAGTLLLDFVLPHGKSLRESSGAECVAIGRWLSRVGARIQPEQIVGLVFTEEKVREIFEQWPR